MSKETFGWSLAAIALFAAGGVFGYAQLSPAQPPAGQPPFASAIDQRNEQIRAQQQTNDLLREQIKLLREQLEIMKASKTK